jgi:hypothetical protein
VLTPSLAEPLAAVVSYGAAQTKARGTFEGENAVTTVEASVNDVRVTNRPAPEESDDLSPIEFRAGALKISLLSRHPHEGEPFIEFAETPLFQDMSLNGRPIVLELNTELMGLTRWSQLQNRFRKDQEFFNSCAFAPAHSAHPPAAFGEGIPYTVGSYGLCSFVRSIKWGDETIKGHVLDQIGFGTIYFGEILLNDRERRVTMVRMRLGSDNSGQAVFAEGDPNGTWIPPR